MVKTRKIDKPEIKMLEIFDSIPNLRYQDRIIEKSEKYEESLNDLQTFLDDEKRMIEKDAEYEQYMKDLYSKKFSNNKYSVYKFYSKIRNAQDYCPYCNFLSRSVRQLDHYLPKAIFPSLAITPLNLVPICTECNDKKRTYYSVHKNKMLIHPYYDDFIEDAFEFIKCSIVENKKIGFVFYIDKLVVWDECTYERVKTHFNVLDINDLYRTDFEANFTSFFDEIKSALYDGDDLSMIKRMVRRKRDSYINTNKSPWLYAGYDTILNSKWFFDEYLSKYLL